MSDEHLGESEPKVIRRYAYYIDKPLDPAKPNAKTTAYIVERFDTGNVVARITHLGNMNVVAAEDQINIALIRHGLSASQQWQQSSRSAVRKTRLVQGTDFD